jgi:AcrR family transcriptional regulator
MSTPRDQILATATRLFFSQGYIATGINQLIAESEVARRTFYHHFPSKEDVGAEYIELASRQWLAALREAVATRRTAAGVVRGIFELVEQIARETHFRGCAMLNMAAEFAQASSAMRGRVKRAKEAQTALLVELLGALSVSSATARQIDVLLEGAMSSAGAHLEVQPIRAALHAALSLIEHEEGSHP